MASIWAPDWTTDIAYIGGTFALLGVTFHLSIIPFEIDTIIRNLLVAYFVSWVGLAVALWNFYSLDLLFAIWKASIAGLAFNVGLGASTIVYRLFFHRLREFPGPLSTKVSRFSTVSSVLKSGVRYYLVLQDLHQIYGDFVRTGPRGISVIRPSAVRAVYGPQSKCRKATWYSQVGGDSTKISLLGLRDPDEHRARRRVWDRGLGPKALLAYTPKIQAKTDVLMDQLHARVGQSVTITQWTMHFAFDVMGVIAFSKDFHQLEDASEHSVIKAMHDQMLVMGILTPVPWLIYLLLYFPSLAGSYAKFMKYSAEQIEQRKAIWLSGVDETPTDLISWILKENGALGKLNLQDLALHEEGRLAIVAGSDTAGSTLSNVLYFLAQNPDKYKRLQREVDEAALEGTFTDGSPTLSYLEAVITETLRLKPVVVSSIPRMTPPDGLVIDEVWIPGNTIVIVPSYVVQRDERSFVNALEFIPERWLEEGKDLVIHQHSWFPFSLGSDACVGKQLALLQMRGVIRRIAKDFDISLAPGEDGVAFDTKSQDTFTTTLKPLEMVFNKRDPSIT